jgi:hypothetical protein
MSLHPAYLLHGSAKPILAMVTSSFQATAQAHCLRLVTSDGFQSAWLPNKIIPFEVSLGQVWSFTGEIVNLGQYGEQFEIMDGMPSLPAGVLLIPFLAFHIAGLSQARAQRMWETLGDGLVDAMEHGEVSFLAGALRGPASVQIATLIIQVWKEHAAYIRLAQQLYRYGFNEQILRAVIRHYGERSLERLRNDPYRLLAFAELWPVDQTALKHFDICVDDERRLMGIVDAAVYALNDRGTSIFLPTQLQTMVHQLASLGRQQVVDAVNLALLHGRLVAATEHHLMGDGFARMERAVIRFLGMCNRSPPEQIATLRCTDSDDAGEVALAVSETAATGVSIIVTREETAAFAFVKYLTKTWDSRGMVCNVLGGSDALCQRIQAATGIRAVAIQRALEDGLAETETTGIHRAIAIVSSTIDFVTMAKLLPQLHSTDRLFFIGKPSPHGGERSRLLPALLSVSEIFQHILSPVGIDCPVVNFPRRRVLDSSTLRTPYAPSQSEREGLSWVCVADDAFERAIVGISHQLRRHGSVIIIACNGDERQHYAKIVREALGEIDTTVGLGMVSVVTVDDVEPGDSDSGVIALRQPEGISDAWLQAALDTVASRAVVVSTAGIEYQLSATDDNSDSSRFLKRWLAATSHQAQQEQIG